MIKCSITSDAEGDLTEHQKHQPQYTCRNVIAMEQFYGPHADDCPWVGYIAPQACKCVTTPVPVPVK